jgi:hypothetical protein
MTAKLLDRKNERGKVTILMTPSAFGVTGVSELDDTRTAERQESKPR